MGSTATRALWIVVAVAAMGVGINGWAGGARGAGGAGGAGTGGAGGAGTVGRVGATYTARVGFSVAALPPAIGSGGVAGGAAGLMGGDAKLTQEEIRLIIARQQFLFAQDKFLNDVLMAAEFHPEDKPNHECAWLAENKADALKALKRDLKIVPRADQGSFEVTMTTHDPMEAYTLVSAAVKVFVATTLSAADTRRRNYLRNLADALQTAQAKLTIQSDALMDWQKRRGINLAGTRLEAEQESLKALNQEYLRSDAAASAAEMKYEQVKKQKADGKPVALSAEALQEVENDATLRGLTGQKMALGQDRAAATAEAPADARRLREIDARLGAIDEQIKQWRGAIEEAARQRMIKRLEDDATDTRFLASYIGDMRKMKDEVVSAMGDELLVWQSKFNEMKQQEALVQRLRDETALAQANLAVDDSQIVQIAEAVVPTKGDE